MTKSILVIDDEKHFCDRLALALERRDYNVFKAYGYDEAIATIKSQSLDMAVCDLKMPEKNGLALIRDALKINANLKIVVLTGYGSIATAIDAVKLGAVSYLSKPADVDEILLAFTKNPDVDVNVETDPITPPSLARTEWEHINRVLAECDGNISQTAKRLNIHRRTLQRKLQKYPPKT